MEPPAPLRPPQAAAFTVWVDADGAPAAMLDILYKAARTRKVFVVVVANRWIQVPRSTFVAAVQVAQGLDVADEWIVEKLAEGDLVVSADVPLAAAAVERGATVLQHRGDLLDASNVKQRLQMRDFMEELRSTGVTTGGPPPYDVRAREGFANALDRWLTRRMARAGR